MAGLLDARPAGQPASKMACNPDSEQACQQASKKAGCPCSRPLSFQKTIAANQELLQQGDQQAGLQS
jgi:hypothetical protein